MYWSRRGGENTEYRILLALLFWVCHTLCHPCETSAETVTSAGSLPRLALEPGHFPCLLITNYYFYVQCFNPFDAAEKRRKYIGTGLR